MQKSQQVLTAKSSPLIIERVQGRPDMITVGINVAMAAPDVAMYADYVHLRKVRDGVQVIFGKTHPLVEGEIVQAADISFPFRAFVNQLYKSVNSVRPGGQPSFKESVDQAAKRFGYEKIDGLAEPKQMKQVTAFRSNFVAMALQEDDAAIDFHHLDAATMQAALQAVAANAGQAPLLGFKGVLRVVVSPSLLLYFLETACKTAEEIKAATPGIEESPTVEVTQ